MWIYRYHLSSKNECLDQILSQHESLHHGIDVISAKIEIPHGGNFFSKKNEFEFNYCKAAFVLVKISF
jgi:hypothetical protein